MDLEGAKRAACAGVEAVAPLLKAASREMYEKPELGFQERTAAAILTGLLEGAGFAVERGLGGMATAFRAALGAEGTDGPTVALLAEYDALPGVGHGCGHNLIGAAAVGAGMALAGLGPLPGRLLVLGCPAEEGAVDGAGGKVVLVEAGVFDDVDAALMVHPAGRDAPSGGSLCRLALEIGFHGRAAHAAGAPHEGINALEAVIQTFNAVNALRQHLPGSVRVHGIVVKGGEAPNVVPDEGLIRLYVRAPSLPEAEAAAVRVTNCAKGAALATGCRVEFREFAHPYVDLRPNGPLEEAFARNMAALGRPPAAVVAEAGHGVGSTDMGNVSHVVAAIHPYIGIGTGSGGPPPHSREFAEATVSPAGQEALTVGAKALAMTCLDLFLEPELLEAVLRAGPRKGRGLGRERRC